MRKLIVVLALLGLVLAGCSDDDEPTVSSDGETTSTAGGSTAPEGKDAVAITMGDYSYAVDGALKAGGTLKMTNAGKEFHMVGVGKFKEGKTLADLQAALSQPPPGADEGGGDDQTSTPTAEAPAGDEEGDGADPTADVVDEVELPVGSIFGPGQGAEITVPDFGEGEYALICFIPTEGDPEQTPHFAKGMVNTLTVTDEKAPEPTADATYAMAAGKAVTGPATLTAGRHVLKVTVSGDGSEELEPTLVKPDAGKTIADMDRAFDSLFQAAMPANAADKIPGDLVVGAFDFGPAKAVYLTVDLTPGTYTLSGQDTDDEDAPSDPVEKILIKVS